MIFDWKTEARRYHRYFVNLGQLTQRKDVRSWTNLTLSFLTIAFFGFFAIKPTLVIIAKLAKEIKDKEEINLKLQKKIASLVKAQEEYSIHQSRFYLVGQALPQTADFPSLIFFLEEEASSSGIEIKSFSINKVEILPSEKAKTKEEKVPSFEFTVYLTGDYQNLEDFLGRIESSRRIITIKNVNFGQTKKEKEETSKIILTILGDSSFYPTIDQEQL